MISKKICMLGGTNVGKTSLVRRFVHSIFSEEYHTTIGVKIDKKVVETAESQINLLIWDIQGEEKHKKVMPSYFNGMAGYLLIVDASRLETVQEATTVHERVMDTLGNIPFILVLNKCDLLDNFDAINAATEALQSQASSIIRSSAKTGESVEAMFEQMASIILNAPSRKKAS